MLELLKIETMIINQAMYLESNVRNFFLRHHHHQERLSLSKPYVEKKPVKLAQTRSKDQS